MRVLITGGCGFIGSHTCLVLLKKGYELLIVDSFINSKKDSLEKVKKILKDEGHCCNNQLKLIKVDLRNKKSLEDIFLNSMKENNPIKGVFHFAGLKSVSDSINNPFEYWDANVNGSINLFSVMEKFNCSTIVFSSSATIYGLSESSVLTEKDIIEPINPYGTTKFVIEKLLEDISKKKPVKWRIANLRYFNPIGAHNSGLIGEDPLGTPNNIFPIIMRVASRQLEKLQIFGKDWPTKDGTCMRDYIHVMDLAEGHLAAFEFLMNEKPQIISLNLGTGLGNSVLDLVNTFEQVNNIKIPYEFVDRREGDAASVIADNSFAISKIDWLPKRTLKDMCIDGWKWQVLNPKGY